MHTITIVNSKSYPVNATNEVTKHHLDLYMPDSAVREAGISDREVFTRVKRSYKLNHKEHKPMKSKHFRIHRKKVS